MIILPSFTRFCRLGLALSFLLPWGAAGAAEGAVEEKPSQEPAATASTSRGRANTFKPLKPGPMDGQISLVTASLLEKYHYLREPFNGALSSKFLDHHLEVLDPQHLHFLQTDLADFEPWRTNLDRMILPSRSRTPEVRPAFIIYNRFVERVQERVNYADYLLQNEQFTFDADERVTVIRKDLPYPKDLAEAKKIWRDRLRYEYLQEKLGKSEARKKAAAAKASVSEDELISPEKVL